jgi:predicted nucleic acid-binding protein
MDSPRWNLIRRRAWFLRETPVAETMKAVLLNDASVLLNLLATEQIEAIGASVGWQFAICSAVRDEVKKLRDRETGEMLPVDIAGLVSVGALRVLHLEGDDEEALYVEHASMVDDGEAMSLAIASARQFELAMDDKRARRLARQRYPDLTLWTTPEIVKLWSEKSSTPSSIVRTAVLSIESRARYFPPGSHPLACWWQQAKQSTHKDGR